MPFKINWGDGGGGGIKTVLLSNSLLVPRPFWKPIPPKEVPLVLSVPFGLSAGNRSSRLISSIWVLFCYTVGPAIPTGPSRGHMHCYTSLSHAVSIRLSMFTTTARKLLLKEECLQPPAVFWTISRTLCLNRHSGSCWAWLHVKFQGTQFLDRPDLIRFQFASAEV